MSLLAFPQTIIIVYCLFSLPSDSPSFYSFMITISWAQDQPHNLKFPVQDEIQVLMDFPRGPVVKTSPSNTWGVGLIPGQGAKISHTLQPKKPKRNTEAILYQIE